MYLFKCLHICYLLFFSKNCQGLYDELFVILFDSSQKLCKSHMFLNIDVIFINILQSLDKMRQVFFEISCCETGMTLAQVYYTIFRLNANSHCHAQPKKCFAIILTSRFHEVSMDWEVFSLGIKHQRNFCPKMIRYSKQFRYVLK